MLQAAGIESHRVDEGGLDHGIWTPLRYAYPQADVPVLPLGFVPTWTPAQLHRLRPCALAPLADEGVLVVGSGSLTHNLRMVFGAAGRPPEVDSSAEFRQWVLERAAAADWPALNDYRRQAPHAALMHLTDEHWLPWYPAAGAAGMQPWARGCTTASPSAALGMMPTRSAHPGPTLARALIG